MKLAFTNSALVLATALLTLSATFANASEVVYRWKDEAGNQVNSDRPPPEGIEYETMSTSSSMVHAVDPAEGTVPATVKPGAGKDAAAAAATAPAVKKNPGLCERAREYRTQLNTKAQVRLRNEQGEVHYISEEEKATEREKAENMIETYCE